MEEIAKQVTLNVSHAVEMIAAVLIRFALLQVVFNYIRTFFSSGSTLTKEEIRVKFGSSVAVALELMLGADVLSTAVAPSWDDIGKLGAIAIIRTALNYFLGKELKEIKEEKIATTGESKA